MGFSKSYIGTYMAMGTLAAAIAAIPIGVVADRVGRKKSVLWAIALTTLAAIGEVAILNPMLLLGVSFAKGVGSTFKQVVQNPFLMENSTPDERIHLFSVNQALQTVASVLGSGLAGLFPLLLAFAAQSFGWLEFVEVAQLRMALAFSIIFLLISSNPLKGTVLLRI
jgi:MFS family permease